MSSEIGSAGEVKEEVKAKETSRRRQSDRERSAPDPAVSKKADVTTRYDTFTHVLIANRSPGSALLFSSPSQLGQKQPGEAGRVSWQLSLGGRGRVCSTARAPSLYSSKALKI